MALKTLTILLTLFASLNLLASPISRPELNQKVLEEIQGQGNYIQIQSVENAPWPEYTVVLPLNISSKDAMAIFSIYEEQKEYVPGVLSAQIVKEVSPTDHHVAFEMYMPWPLSNTHYTTGNRMYRLGQKDYAVEWYYVNSDSTKENRGQATFISKDAHSSYLHYRSFIYPSSSFASFVKSKVKGDLLKTLFSIRSYLEKKHQASQAQLERLDQLLPLRE